MYMHISSFFVQHIPSFQNFYWEGEWGTLRMAVSTILAETINKSSFPFYTILSFFFCCTKPVIRSNVGNKDRLCDDIDT